MSAANELHVVFGSGPVGQAVGAIAGVVERVRQLEGCPPSSAALPDRATSTEGASSPSLWSLFPTVRDVRGSV